MSELSPRSKQIRKDLVSLNERKLCSEDTPQGLDWMATEIEEDEKKGWYTWPTKEKKAK